MKPQKINFVVPWRNPEQFRKVYKCLYSQSITDKRWAIDQISVWETRCFPALPPEVEATAALVRAVIQDSLFEVGKSFYQASDVQMIYSMAVVRFVNLILEIDQDDQSKMPMIRLAEQKNIPTWIVELRHEASHSFCPSLPELRMGAQEALNYLEEAFWKMKAAKLAPIVKTPSSDEQVIQDLLIQYKSIQHKRLAGTGQKHALVNDLSIVIKRLRTFIEGSRELAFECLLAPDVFISAEDLVKSLKAAAPSFVEFNTALPNELERFWFPIIRVLHAFDLIPIFIEELMLSQERCDILVCQKLAAAWVTRFLLAATAISNNTGLDSLFKEKGVLFNFYRLLYACMKGASIHFLPIFELIIHRLGNQDRFKQLFCILALKQGWLLDKKVLEPRQIGPGPASKRARDLTMQEIVFTLEDVEEDLNEIKKRKKRPRRDDNIWSLAPVGMKWSEIPLGTILNPVNEVDDGSVSPNTEQYQETEEEPHSFILINKSDNEEITVEENTEQCSDMCPRQMMYNRRQQN